MDIVAYRQKSAIMGSVTKLLRLRMPKPVSSPTRCSAWETLVTNQSKIKWYWETRYLKDLNRIDGEPMEFEWTIFSGSTTLGILGEIQKLMTELQCEPEQFKDRIIFTSMYNDIVWRERGHAEKCESNSREVANHARKFPRGRWSFLGLGSEKKWYGTYSDKPTDPGTKLQRK